MRKLLFLGLLVLSFHQPISAQWIQNEALTGGSIINDIIRYKGSIYVAINDNGLYRSIDNGDSWSFVDVGYDWSIDRLEIHKDEILAATSGKLFKSGDGVNWTENNFEGSFVKKIQSDGENIYIATLIGGVIKSIDDGITWTNLSDGAISEGVEAFEKNGDILYASKNDNSGTLYKSTDDGINWEQITVESGKWINGIYAGNDGIYLNLTDNILFSPDNGSNWADITNGLTGHRISQLYYYNDILFANANGQVFTTIDNGANWKSSQNYISGFNCTALYVNESNIFIGMWGGGVARNTINLDQAWSIKNEGLMLTSVNDLTAINDTIFVGSGYSFVRTSFDQGVHWQQAKDKYGFRSGSANHLTIYKNTPYVGTGGGGILKPDIEQNYWKTVSDDLPGQIINGLCSNDIYIFTAVSGEGIYRSEDPENGWIQKSAGFASGIRGLYAFKNFIFAGTWSGLFMSDDAGDSWNDISGNLAGKSINSVTYVDSTIFIATQNNGMFRSSNLGIDWENISAETISHLKAYKSTVIKGSHPGNLAISDDLGNTWRTVDDNALPKNYVIGVAFTSDYMFVGFGRPGQGIWQRQLHEIFPPALSVEVKDSIELVLREEGGIVIESDQQLTTENGEKLDSLSLHSLITVYDSNSSEIEFEASIDSSSMKITIVINAPVDGQKYVVEIDSMTNESGLRSAKYTSQEYEFHKNAPPVLSKIQKIGLEKQEITISSTDFSHAFSDQENDPFEFLQIIQSPKHGLLYKGAEAIEDNTIISFNELTNLVYKPNSDFIGQDSVTWNGFDGYDFASENASVTLRIDAITGFEEESQWYLSLYPNPAHDQINSFVRSDYTGTYRFILSNINGRILKEFEIEKDMQDLEYSISLRGLRNGLYILRLEGNGLNVSHKIVKN